MATKLLPTLPLEPTKYPSSLECLTNLCAIKYIGSNPPPIIPPSSFLTFLSIVSSSSKPSSSLQCFLTYSFTKLLTQSNPSTNVLCKFSNNFSSSSLVERSEYSSLIFSFQHLYTIFPYNSVAILSSILCGKFSPYQSLALANTRSVTTLGQSR